jgi:hypothetical protein
MANPNGNPEFLPQRGPGRPKGSVNRYTKTVKEALLQSFNNQGGVEFFDKLAKKNPTLYAQCLMRLIPAEVQAEVNSNVKHGLADDLVARLNAGRDRVAAVDRGGRSKTIEATGRFVAAKN